jgi:hypothetical protein
LLILFFNLLITSALAQEQTDLKKDTQIEQRIETLTEGQEDAETDYSNLLEELVYYRDHPLNLNDCSADDLKNLNLLTDIQIASLLRHIDKAGKLISIYELQGVDGFDLESVRRILPFVKVESRFDQSLYRFSDALKYGKHALIFRFQQVLNAQAGFSPASDSLLLANPNSRFLGRPQGLFTRYRFTYGNRISLALNAENDPGEEFFKGSNRQGFDFYSGHLAFRKIWKFKTLVFGDYLAQFGQGLTFWMGQGFGKSADPLLVKRNARGIVPSNSINEALFMRGAAATVAFGKWEITAFASRKKIDANVARFDSLDNQISEVSSFQLSGLHRTPSELADKDAITESFAGGNFNFRGKALNLGLTAVSSGYSAPLRRELGLYNRFEFSSGNNFNAGLDYQGVWKNINYFGEFSRSANGGLAAISGLIASLDPRFALSMVWRNFARDYQNLYANTVGEATRSANEKGLLTGFTLRPWKTVSLNGYYDLFRFPWLSYNASAPVNGRDYLVQLNYIPSKRTEMYLRYRNRVRPYDVSLPDNPIDFPANTVRENLRFNIIYPVLPSLRFRNRVEWVRFTENGKIQEGFMLYHDISYKPMDLPLNLTLRYALFDTDGFDTRLYALESDVLYAFSFPAYFEKGSRFYFLIKYDIGRNTELWLRYSNTLYVNRSVISEGSLNEISGPARNDIKVQLRVSF